MIHLSIKVDNKLFGCGFDRERNGHFLEVNGKAQQEVLCRNSRGSSGFGLIDSLDDLLLNPQTLKFFKKVDRIDGLSLDPKSHK